VSHVGNDAYLAAERCAEEKQELSGGEVLAMAGTSFAHNQIAANVGAGLRQRLRARRCAVLLSGMRALIPSKPGIVYLDLTVTADEPRFRDDEQDVLLNPTLVIEVLSEGTDRFDRGDKFAANRSVESILPGCRTDSAGRKREQHYRIAVDALDPPGRAWASRHERRQGHSASSRGRITGG
jgi:hypothetical protein